MELIRNLFLELPFLSCIRRIAFDAQFGGYEQSCEPALRSCELLTMY
jgi:hypothetical protein